MGFADGRDAVGKNDRLSDEDYRLPPHIRR